MVLEAFWGPLGLILGALGALWGSHGGSLGAPELLKSLGPFDPRAFLSLLMFFLFFVFLSFFSMSFFISPRSLLGSILSSQTDPPTIKNDDFMRREFDFLKIIIFDPTMVLEAFWGSQGDPKSTQLELQVPTGRPRSPQEHPKGPREDPKKVPRAPKSMP